MKKVTIYIHSSINLKTKENGYAFVLEYLDSKNVTHKKIVSKATKNFTIRQITIISLNEALESLKPPCSVYIITDSDYLKGFLKENHSIVESFKRDNLKIYFDFEKLRDPHIIENIKLVKKEKLLSVKNINLLRKERLLDMRKVFYISEGNANIFYK